MKYHAKIDLSNKNNSHTLAFNKIDGHAAGRRLKILEVGCASGYFGAAVADHGHDVWGVEPDADAAQNARHLLHFVHTGTIETFFSENPSQQFDAIVFGDVLEHLLDPADILRKCQQHLLADGLIVASVPNVAHLAIRAMLLEGRWDYADLGILDKTHLRFFTKNSLVDLFSDSGYAVQCLDSVRLSAEQVNDLCAMNLNSRSIQAARAHSFDSYMDDFQYVVSACLAKDSKNTLIDNARFKSDSELRIVCLVHDAQSSLVEIRLKNPLQRWASTFGGDYRLVEVHNHTQFDLLWGDVFVFQRASNEYIDALASQLKAAGKKIIFEIDDYLWKQPPFLTHHVEATEKQRPYVERLIKNADAVSVSTNALKNKFIHLNENIFIAPNYSTSIGKDVHHFDAAASEIHLIVASSDSVEVDMLITPFMQLQSELNVKVVGIGPPGRRLAEKGVRVSTFENMNHEQFKGFISSFENSIGVIPLDESEFSSCKSAVKYFDYAMVNIPSVCSNVPPYADVMNHGRNGILVNNTHDAWLTELRKLIISHESRISLASAARENVLHSHSLDHSVQAWTAMLASLNIHIDRTCQVPSINPVTQSFWGLFKQFIHHAFHWTSYVAAFRVIREHGVGELVKRFISPSH